MNETIKLKGTCEFILRGPDGKIKAREVIENDVTDLGFDKIADLIGGASSASITHLGIGWGTGAGTAFAPSQTDLQGANKDRKAAGYSHTPGTKTFLFNATWGTNEPIAGTVPIEEIGTFDAASGGIMLSRLVRAVLNKAALDTLEINYNFTMS